MCYLIGKTIFEMNKLGITALVFITFLVVVAVTVLNFSGIINTYQSLIINFVVAVYFLTILFFLKSVKDKDEYRKLTLKQDEYNSNLNNFITVLRTERHDFMNHFTVVSGLLSMGRAEQAEKYLKDLIDMTKVNSQLLAIKQPTVIALVNGKIAQAAAKGISNFSVVVKSNLVDLRINSTDLTAILGNLIDNAIDAAVSDFSEPGFISISFDEDPEYYAISISNSGLPIPQDFIKEIFKPGVSSKGQGRGFGLSIVMTTVQKYKGTIDVASGPTTFNILLPRGTSSD